MVIKYYVLLVPRDRQEVAFLHEADAEATYRATYSRVLQSEKPPYKIETRTLTIEEGPTHL